MQDLLSINQYGALLLDSIKRRQEFIDSTQDEQLGAAAEAIQQAEIEILKKAIALVPEWETQKARKKKPIMIRKTVLGKEISCVEAPTFARVGPELSYIPEVDHFALRVAGVLIHGNIGQIIDTKTPERIKNCKNKNCKRTHCSFYHDPMEYGGTERRNFLMRNKYGNDYGGVLTGESLSRFSDRIMHDILTLLVNSGG